MSQLKEARRNVSEEGSIAAQLKLLLDIPSQTPVYATPSFEYWLSPVGRLPWPPPPDASGGLVLIDTRDRAARRDLASVGLTDGAARFPFDAALILTGSGRPGNAIKRALRRVLYPGTRRLPEARVAASMRTSAGGIFVSRLAFNDDLDVPAEFKLIGNPHSTGAGFLITRTPPFRSALWSKSARWLKSDNIAVESFQLRMHGAAVITLRASGVRYIVRVVPAGDLQAVVSRNHSALLDLRALLASSKIREFVPAPVFAEGDGDTLVLGETLLEGTLAWRVAAQGLADAVHRNALEFLEQLRAATGQSRTLGGDDIRELLAPDEALIARSSSFVSPTVRTLMERELRENAACLEGKNLRLQASHGDFGYGNILVDEKDGTLSGVIDWDTARLRDLPGIDRVNLEIQARRSLNSQSFEAAVESVWRDRSVHAALVSDGDQSCVRALFGLAVCRFMVRSFTYPSMYPRGAAGIERALGWLSRTGRQA